MSRPRPPQPAKLVIGLIYREAEEAERGWKAMEERWGAVDILSPVWPFRYTRYYEKEMGAPLYRRWAFFREPVEQDRLVPIKREALELEQIWQEEGRRRLNIDPGLLTAERLVLSTGKNYSHRIYLGQGIYGDLTLIFSSGAFRPLPWTYPDYRQPEVLRLFQAAREKYLRDMTQDKRGKTEEDWGEGPKGGQEAE